MSHPFGTLCVLSADLSTMGGSSAHRVTPFLEETEQGADKKTSTAIYSRGVARFHGTFCERTRLGKEMLFHKKAYGMGRPMTKKLPRECMMASEHSIVFLEE